MANIVSTEDFTIECITPQVGRIYVSDQDKPYTGFDKNYLILDYGEKNINDPLTCNLIFTSEKYKINATGSSCGCTDPQLSETEDENKQQVSVTFSKNKLSKNVEKTFTLYLNNNSKVLKIILLINK